jgi:tetratricopeptide (TPR) repeat protein
MQFVEQQLADEYLVQEQYSEAIALYEQCICIAPDVMSNYWKLGLALLLQDEESAAQAVWLQAFLQANDDQIDVFTEELIKVLETEGLQRLKSGKYQQAEKIYRQILEQNPNNSEAYKNLGNSVVQQGKVDEAIYFYQQALTLVPDDAEATNNLGYAFQLQGKIEQAIAHYQHAITLAPNYAHARYNFGVRLLEKHQFEQAIACFNRAIEIDPNHAEAHWNRGLILLTWGDYERGFVEYEWRWIAQKVQPRHVTQPVWHGEDLQGRTILLHAEQGFGDTIHFIRYAVLVQARGGKVVVECHELLVRLLRTVSGINKVIAIGTELPEFDVHASLLSLPYILGTTLETIPAHIPYVHHDPSLSFKLENQKANLKVGIVWAGNPEHVNDRNRSCSLKDFLSILNTPGISFYSLQKGHPVGEIAELSEKVPLQDLSSQLHDFADTAAVVAQLDLIITVDTAVAHLAAALGRPVWVVISFIHDWRWLLEREDSPWYPSMRLFRQQQPGDWTEVLGRVQVALLSLKAADC